MDVFLRGPSKNVVLLHSSGGSSGGKTGGRTFGHCELSRCCEKTAEDLGTAKPLWAQEHIHSTASRPLVLPFGSRLDGAEERMARAKPIFPGSLGQKLGEKNTFGAHRVAGVPFSWSILKGSKGSRPQVGFHGETPGSKELWFLRTVWVSQSTMARLRNLLLVVPICKGVCRKEPLPREGSGRLPFCRAHSATLSWLGLVAW